MRVRFWAAFWAIVAGVTAVVCGHLVRTYEWSYGARVVLALAPVIPMGIYCVLAVRIVRGLDELEARVHLEGALFALLGSAMVTMTAGLLVKSGLIPPVTLGSAWPWLWTIAFLLWGAGTFIAGARYR